MLFKIRIVLDVQHDVIRTILIDANASLEEFHNTIAEVFGFNGQQMASFYRSDENWTQGEEIPLLNMDESPNALCMANTRIAQNIEDIGDKLIYVYDFLNMWTFFVELIETIEKVDESLPKIVLSIGEVPEEAPKKQFTAEKESNDDYYDMGDDYENESFDNFENIDDLPSDLY